jgi:hypothetical protein
MVAPGYAPPLEVRPRSRLNAGNLDAVTVAAADREEAAQ